MTAWIGLDRCAVGIALNCCTLAPPSHPEIGQDSKVIRREGVPRLHVHDLIALQPPASAEVKSVEAAQSYPVKLVSRLPGGLPCDFRRRLQTGFREEVTTRGLRCCVEVTGDQDRV